MQTYIRTLLLYFLYFVVFTVPLYFTKTVYRQFDIGKALLFKMAIAIITIFWVLKYLVHKDTLESLRPSRIFVIPVVFFTLNVILSTIFGVDPIMSLIGVYERQIGLQGFLYCFLAYFIVIQISDKKNNEALLHVLLLSSLIISVHGVLQYFGYFPFGLGRKAFDRIGGFLGNANFIADYLSLLLPFCIYFFFKNREWPIKIFYLVLLVFQLLAIFFSQTRGVYIAVVAGVVANIFTFIVINKDEKYKGINFYLLASITFLPIFALSSLLVANYTKWLTVLITILLLAGMIVFYFRMSKKYTNQKPKLVIILTSGIIILSLALNIVLINLKSQNNLVKRYYSIFDSQTATVQTRALVWKDCLRLAVDMPITGIGLETFRATFSPYKDPKLEILAPRVEYDNPHNNFIYILITLGPLGLLAYLWVIFRFLRLSLSVIRDETRSRMEQIMGIGYFTSFVIYSTWSLSGFDFLASLLAFWMIVASFSIWYDSLEKDDAPTRFWELDLIKRIKPKKIYNHIFIGFLLLLIPISIVSGYTMYEIYRADKFFYGGLVLKGRKNLYRSTKYFQKAIDINPYESYYYEQISKNLLDMARTTMSMDERMSLVAKSEAYIKQGLKHSWAPENLYIRKLNGRLLLNDRMGAIRAAKDTLKHSPNLTQVKGVLQKLLNFNPQMYKKK